MRLDGCFKAILFLGLFVGFCAHATVFTKACGEYRYIVELYNGFNISERNYRLYFQDQNGKKQLFYQTDHGMILDAACIKDKNARNLMLFLDITGGNGSPEDRYGVFDPHSNKMLIKPESWVSGNSEEVKALLGYPPPFPQEKDRGRIFFCCANLMYDGEY